MSYYTSNKPVTTTTNEHKYNGITTTITTTTTKLARLKLEWLRRKIVCRNNDRQNHQQGQQNTPLTDSDDLQKQYLCNIGRGNSDEDNTKTIHNNKITNRNNNNNVYYYSGRWRILSFT